MSDIKQRAAARKHSAHRSKRRLTEEQSSPLSAAYASASKQAIRASLPRDTLPR